jgi:hypothetical protein
VLDEQLGANAPLLAQKSVQESGSYEICGLAPGEYRLLLISYTLKPFQISGYQPTISVVGERDVDLGPLEPLAPAELQGTVTVKDTGPGYSMPAGIRIRTITLDNPTLNLNMKAEIVQPDGTFILPRVFAGDNAIRVDGLPAGYYVIGAFQQARNVLEGGLRPGDGDVRITLGADGPVVRGRVLAADDAEIPDASVLLLPGRSGQPLVIQADQTGTYQFTSGVPPGEYRIAAVPDLLEWQRQDAATVARLAADGKEITLGPRESRTIDLRVKAGR